MVNRSVSILIISRYQSSFIPKQRPWRLSCVFHTKWTEPVAAPASYVSGLGEAGEGPSLILICLPYYMGCAGAVLLPLIFPFSLIPAGPALRQLLPRFPRLSSPSLKLRGALFLRPSTSGRQVKEK